MEVMIARLKVTKAVVEVPDEWDENDILKAANSGRFDSAFKNESDDIEYEVSDDC